MNLYKSSYLPNISSTSNNKTHFNYFEIRLNDNKQSYQPISKANRTNTRFHFTSRPASLMNQNVHKINYKQPKSIGKNIRLIKNYQSRLPLTPKEGTLIRNANLGPIINNSSNTKLRLNIGNNHYQQHNTKECPLCHKTLESYRFTFHYSCHPSQILPWIFLGSYKNASDKEEIRLLNIKYVLNCAIECYSHYSKEIKYLHLKLCDHPNFNILNFLDKAVSFIEEAKNNNSNILIHCQLGISRSTSCLIAYLIKAMNYTTMTALQFIKKKRRIVMPNYGFLEQLIKYEKKNVKV